MLFYGHFWLYSNKPSNVLDLYKDIVALSGLRYALIQFKDRAAAENKADTQHTSDAQTVGLKCLGQTEQTRALTVSYRLNVPCMYFVSKVLHYISSLFNLISKPHSLELVQSVVLTGERGTRGSTAQLCRVSSCCHTNCQIFHNYQMVIEITFIQNCANK